MLTVIHSGRHSFTRQHPTRQKQSSIWLVKKKTRPKHQTMERGNRGSHILFSEGHGAIQSCWQRGILNAGENFRSAVWAAKPQIFFQYRHPRVCMPNAEAWGLTQIFIFIIIVMISDIPKLNF